MYLFFNGIWQSFKVAKISIPTIVASYRFGSVYKKSYYGQLNKLSQLHLRRFTTTLDVDTNVTKDVILYKYDNAKYFKIINTFAICQFVFWSYLSHFAYTTLKDAPPEKTDETAPWYRRINLGENKYRNSITIISFLIGYGILFSAWFFTLRSVRYLILRKGGKKLCFVTYGPFNKNRIMDVPVNCVSAQESRHSAKVQLPLKVKNKNFYYILDMRGEFLNKTLFDHTAGLKRRF